MAIEQVIGYRVRCDRCNADAQEDSEYACWLQDFAAIDEARESDWLVTDDGHHFCENCVIWDDDADALVPIGGSPDG